MTKTIKPLDTISTYRERTPTNPRAAYKGFNMSFDHSQQMNVIPDRKKNVLIEATNHAPGDTGAMRCMNDSGGVAHAGSHMSVGGSGDHPGVPYRTGQISKQPSGRTKKSSPQFRSGR